MEIKTMEITEPFKYLWLKTVQGVDLNNHCAKCLIGKYDNRISTRIKEAKGILLENSIYYLCGVSLPFVWANNFHLAFKPEKGSAINISRNGISIEITDAVEIKFSAEDIDKSHPMSSKAQYNTCRNWQFANKYKSITN